MSTDLHTLTGAFALNALSQEEAKQFQTHLDACASCQQEVLELQAAAARMGASEALTPPAHLKARVLAAADRSPQLPPKVRRLESTRSPKWTPRILAAAAAVVMVVGAGIGVGQMQQDEGNTFAAPVAQVFEAPDAQKQTVDTANGGEVSLATSESLGKMAVDTDELPGLTNEQVYQLWAVESGNMVSAGLLEDPKAGAAMDLPDEGIQVAITIEPAGGSEQPTSDPIITVTPSEI